MAAVAAGLAERGIATLRYQFPYMEKGSKRPDPPQVAHAAVRAAVMEAARQPRPHWEARFQAFAERRLSSDPTSRRPIYFHFAR